MKQILPRTRRSRKREADFLERKRKKKGEDRWYVADILIEAVTYGGEALLYGIRALVKWLN